VVVQRCREPHLGVRDSPHSAIDNRGMYTARTQPGFEGMQPVATMPATAPRSRAASFLYSLHGQVTTTPGRLAIIALLVIAAAVCFGAIATAAERSRAHAAQAVRSETEPLLVQASTMYTALSDANATVTATFLKGGLEPPALRARYLQDLRVASRSLTTLTREVGGSSDARAAVGTIGEQLPVYSGLVETARANNRQGLPVGAAYLRAASKLLTSTILPQADRLYSIEAERLSDNYATGTAAAALVVLIVAVVVALVLLIVAQLYIARTSRRNLNVGMLLATSVLLGVSIWAVIGFVGEQNALARSRRNSDAVEVLAATKVLLSRAQSDQSLTLVNRGSDETDPLDFTAVTKALAPLMTEVRRVGGGPGAAVVAGYGSYEAQAKHVLALENGGQLSSAIARASDADTIASRLNLSLAAQIKAAQTRFVRSARSATSSLSGLLIAIPILTVGAAALALVGLRPRMGEYR
jgi:hypothetical protein